MYLVHEMPVELLCAFRNWAVHLFVVVDLQAFLIYSRPSKVFQSKTAATSHVTSVP